MHIKKGDTVVVIAGNDKGRKGKVLRVDTKKNRVVIENVAMVTKHQKPSPRVQQGGIMHREGSVHVSNVQLFDPKTKTGTRTKAKFLADGKKVRVSVKSGDVLE